MIAKTAACFWCTSVWLLGAFILANSQVGPKFTRKVKTEYTVFERSSVKLRCPVTGTSDPRHNRTLVIWLYNRSRIDNIEHEWSRFYVKQGKHLLIRNVSKNDAGIYTCWAYNEYGDVKTHINLIIRTRKKTKKELEGNIQGESPQFKGSVRRHLTFKTGETAKLKCHSTGDPDPHVQWFKNGEPYGKNNKRAGVSASGWTLNLRYLTKQDSGLYMCRVSNKLGEINRTFSVKVKVRVLKPIIEDTDDARIRVPRGKNAVLDCRAESVGEPSFVWRRWGNQFNKFNGSRQLPTSKRSKYLVHEINDVDYEQFEATLVILNVTKYDEGKYSCIVQNKHGSDELSKYLLVIEEVKKPILTTPTSVPSNSEFTRSSRSGQSLSIVAITGIMIGIMVFTAICVLTMVLICRKRRMDLERKFVLSYQPDELLQPRQHLLADGKDQENEKSPSELTLTNNKGSELYASDILNKRSETPENSSAGRTQSTTSDILNTGSRTSSERTLSVSSSREQFIDSTDSQKQRTLCQHPTCGTVCRYKEHTNSNSNHRLRESVV